MKTDVEKPEPRGVAGWLLFFILILTVLGPPWHAWRYFRTWDAVRHSVPQDYASGAEFALLQTVSWTTFAIGVALSIMAGLLLWKRRRASSVKIAIVALWVMGPLLSIAGHFVALYLVDLEFVVGELSLLLVPTASAALWSSYLLTSRRVRNTYCFHGFGRS